MASHRALPIVSCLVVLKPSECWGCTLERDLYGRGWRGVKRVLMSAGCRYCVSLFQGKSVAIAK